MKRGVILTFYTFRWNKKSKSPPFLYYEVPQNVTCQRIREKKRFYRLPCFSQLASSAAGLLNLSSKVVVWQIKFSSPSICCLKDVYISFHLFLPYSCHLFKSDQTATGLLTSDALQSFPGLLPAALCKLQPLLPSCPTSADQLLHAHLPSHLPFNFHQ